MDSDLQHPPQDIPRIVDKLRSGVHHLQMVRRDPVGGNRMRIFAGILFYSFFRKLTRVPLPDGSADFRGFSLAVARAFLALPERGRFNRGLFHWLGFRAENLEYQVRERFAGQSSQSNSTLLRRAFAGIISFSEKPLAWYFAAFAILGAVLALACVAAVAISFSTSNLSPAVFMVCGTIAFWSSILLTGMYLQTLYLRRIFDGIQNRPDYVVWESVEINGATMEKNRGASRPTLTAEVTERFISQ